ncbi:hypothetical protein SRABI106_04134 [Rahnella aquatilis]|nr:hypothetical protein SRABI106_04134 [Rahnella aquatilis]
MQISLLQLLFRLRGITGSKGSINGGQGFTELNALRHFAHVVVPFRLRQGIEMAQGGVLTIGTGQIQRISVNLLRIHRTLRRKQCKSCIRLRRFTRLTQGTGIMVGRPDIVRIEFQHLAVAVRSLIPVVFGGIFLRLRSDNVTLQATLFIAEFRLRCTRQ